MSALPLFGEPDPPAPESVKWTEAAVLTCLRRRYSESHGNGDRWAFATHVKSGAGFYDNTPGSFAYHRAADAVAMDLWPSKGLEIHGHEVKVSRSDWLSELKQPEKCEPVKRYCDRWARRYAEGGDERRAAKWNRIADELLDRLLEVRGR